MYIFQELRDVWSAESIRVSTPATATEVDFFQQRHSVELPGDFAEYLKTAGGMQDGKTDKYLINFASLLELDDATRWTSVEGGQRGLIFADYSVFSHYYVLVLSAGAVIAEDGENSLKLAESFREFVENYLTDPARIANCWTADVPTK